MKMMNMVIISEDMIKPSQPTPPHRRYLKASLFDHVNSPVLMPLIFFYSNKQTPTLSSTLTRLKNSLPKTLSIFYLLAGRVQDSNYIDCNDEGVPFVQAHILSTRLSEIVHKADVSVLDELLPTYGDTQGYTKLLLVIQVNSFACGGIAIGLKISHAISDGFSFAMFIKTWADMANNGCVTVTVTPPRPCFEIWKIFPPHTSVFREPNPDVVATRPTTKWFMFSKAACDALRSRFGKKTKNQPSLTMVLSEFIWSRIKLAQRSEVKNKPNEIYYAVNIRPKVEIPVGYDYYFGNMVVNALANPSADEGFFEATRVAIEKIIQENGVIDEMRNGKENLLFMKDHFEKESKGELVSLGFSTLRSLPVYESDFGWGKPVWVTTASQVFKDLVMMIPGPGGSASEETYAYVSLIPEEMKNLEADLEFMSVVSNSAAFVTSKM